MLYAERDQDMSELGGRYCRVSILPEFQTHVLRLLLHRKAKSILADAFEPYANANGQTIFPQGF